MQVRCLNHRQESNPRGIGWKKNGLCRSTRLFCTDDYRWTSYRL